MNLYEMDLMNILSQEPFIGQRHLAETSGFSVGVVNRTLKSLAQQGYLDENERLTPLARETLSRARPRQAVILAAGFGMRMVPINTVTHKAFLEIRGEYLIERLIRQLIGAGVRNIVVVVGFMKEMFEYLIDKYGVKLIYNPEYSRKNNLYSLYLAREYLENAYILPCDNWAETNPFRAHEMYPWYMVTNEADPHSPVRANRKRELAFVTGGQAGHAMRGIAYMPEKEGKALRKRLEEMCADPKYDGEFWETALYDKKKMNVYARVFPSGDMTEINTYEELRSLDSGSNQLKTDAIDVITRAFDVSPGQVRDIAVLKKGMTNRSFLFRVRDERYIMRIPGEGTEKLIDRREEAAVFQAISGLGLCDDPVYIDPSNGCKITRYLEGARSCDSDDTHDLKRAMKKLRAFHEMGLKVAHRFDIFEKIAFYESLWQGEKSIYRDYEDTKARVLSLRPFIEAQPRRECLTHIDAVPDNFLFYPDGDGEALQLTDWEYAAMQDPHVDIAMFCIYSLYDRERIDRLIGLYFEDGCDADTVTKVYCYIAACGLLWSNWCEYKRQLGVEFGEYGMAQYRFAKDYYRIAKDRIDKAKGA